MIRTLVEIQGGRVRIRETGTGQTEVSVIVDDSVSTVPLGGQEERLYTAEEVGDLQASEAELVAAPLRLQVAALERQVYLYDVDRKTERDRADRNMTRAQKAEAEVERLKKGHVCTRSCKPDAHVAFTGRQRLEELEKEVSDEALRADQNKDWAERAELRLSKDTETHLRRVRELTDSLAARDRLLASSSRDLVEMTAQRDRLLSQLHGPEGPHAKLIEAQEGIKVLAAKIQKINGAVYSPLILSALSVAIQDDRHEALADAVRKVRRIVGSPGPETSPA